MRTYNKVGFIGLGVMGIGMAANLQKAGYELVVNDIDLKRAELLPDPSKVVTVSKPCEILDYTNTVILMLPNSPHVESVINGENGLLSAKKLDDLFIIDMSSISPVVTKKLGEQLEAAGIKFIDAPVSGGQAGATEGKLTIMVGGKKELLDDAMPLFQVVGKNIIHCGETGSGQVVKVVNQLMSAVNLIGMSEGFTLGVKAGVDPEIMMKVIQNGSGRCWAVENRMPEILKGNFKPGFTIDLHKKDISLAVDMAESLNVPLYVTSMVFEIFKQAQVQEKGKLDNGGIITLYEDINGVQVRS
ncbi:MAG: NAD(P)-dependent oxidoreductase [Acetivibrionales bacterium]